MEREIKLNYLLREAKRCITILLIAGLIGGAGYTYRHYTSVKGGQAAIRYASTCNIRVVTASEGDAEWALRESYEISKALALSDEVLGKVAKDKDVAAQGLDVPTIRSYLYSQAYNYGELVHVIVLTPSQELSDLICSRIEKYSVETLKSKVIDASVLQGTTPFGPGVVTIPTDTNSENIVKLAPTDVPSFSAVGVLKHFIVGFCGLAVAVYFVICLLYIIRNKIVYAEEIEDEDIPVIGIANKKNGQLISDEALSNILLRDKSTKKVAVLQLGSDDDPARFTGSWAAHGVTADLLGNVDTNPMVRTKVADSDAAVLLIKSNTVTMEQLKREIRRIRDANVALAGVIFDET